MRNVDFLRFFSLQGLTPLPPLILPKKSITLRHKKVSPPPCLKMKVERFRDLISEAKENKKIEVKSSDTA